MKLTEYTVYFDQVNQTKYTIKARNEEAAIDIACRLWREDYVFPLCTVETTVEERQG